MRHRAEGASSSAAGGSQPPSWTRRSRSWRRITRQKLLIDPAVEPRDREYNLGAQGNALSGLRGAEEVCMAFGKIDDTLRHTRLEDESPSYIAKREELRLAEIDLTRQRERVAELRRRLPEGPIVQNFVFEEASDESLSDVHAPHRQPERFRPSPGPERGRGHRRRGGSDRSARSRSGEGLAQSPPSELRVEHLQIRSVERGPRRTAGFRYVGLHADQGRRGATLLHGGSVAGRIDEGARPRSPEPGVSHARLHATGKRGVVRDAGIRGRGAGGAQLARPRRNP